MRGHYKFYYWSIMASHWLIFFVTSESVRHYYWVHSKDIHLYNLVTLLCNFVCSFWLWGKYDFRSCYLDRQLKFLVMIHFTCFLVRRPSFIRHKLSFSSRRFRDLKKGIYRIFSFYYDN